MAKRSRMMKKHGMKLLGLVLVLGVLGWLAYLTVQQSKEGMESDNRARALSALVVRLFYTQPSDKEKELVGKLNAHPEALQCVSDVVSSEGSMKNVLDALQKITDPNFHTGNLSDNSLVMGLAKCGVIR